MRRAARRHRDHGVAGPASRSGAAATALEAAPNIRETAHA